MKSRDTKLVTLVVILEELSDDRIFFDRFYRFSADSADSLQNDRYCKHEKLTSILVIEITVWNHIHIAIITVSS